MPYVEPKEKVRKILFEAINSVGMEKFLKEVGASREEAEEWLKGRGWVPVTTLLIACTISGGRSGALERLNEVMEELRVVNEPIVRASPERTKASRELPVEAPKAGMEKGRARTEANIETEAEVLRRRSEMSRTFSMLLLKSTILVLSMFLASLGGYILGSSFGTLYAGLGLLIPIIVGIVICLLWSLKAKAS